MDASASSELGGLSVSSNGAWVRGLGGCSQSSTSRSAPEPRYVGHVGACELPGGSSRRTDADRAWWGAPVTVAALGRACRRVERPV